MKRLLFFFLLVFCLFLSGRMLSAVEGKTNDLEEVISEGFGLTEEEAQLAAIKEGVRKVVGELVDAETVIKNRQIVEKILLASRATVEKHEVLSSGKDTDGIWTVKLLVSVKRTVLAERLKSNGIQMMIFDGSNAAMQLVFKKGQDAENIRFLAKYFRDNQFPYSLIDIVLDENVQTIDKRDKSSSTAATSPKNDGVTVVIRYRVKPNMEKYNLFRDGLNTILGKLAVRKFPVPMFLSPMEQYTFTDRTIMYGRYCLNLCPDTMTGSIGYKTPLPSQTGNIFLLVFQSQSGKFKNSKWMAYELPAVFKEYLIKYSCIIPVVNVSIYNKDNVELISKYQPLEIENSRLNRQSRWDAKAHAVGIFNYFPFFGREDHQEYCNNLDASVITQLEHDSNIFFLGPMTSETATEISSGLCCIYPYLNLSATFDMTLDELKNVGKTGVEIITENFEMDKYYEKLDANTESTGSNSENPF